MGKYEYKAKKGPGEIVKGVVEAQSKEEAIEKLSQDGYLPVSIEETSQSAQVQATLAAKPLGRVKAREVTIFSRQLASLLKSGVPILHAINIILEQSDNIKLRFVLNSIHDAIKEGDDLSSALVRYPNIFPPLYIAMVRTGEQSGVLPEALLRISDYRRKQEEMFSRFRMALTYPVLMAIVGVGTVIFMLTFVMPRLMGIFTSMGQDLPLPTQILISISQGLRQWWHWIALVLAIIILILKQEMKTKTGKLSLSLFKLHLPIFGKFILKAELARFSRTLEMLIKNGIPILKALEVSIPVLQNEIIKNRLVKSYRELEQGGSFGKSLKDAKLFPIFMTNLIIVGEESGKLEESLAEVASSYERDTDEAIEIMSTLLEPLMILGMGLIVGFLVIAKLMPIFEINLIARYKIKILQYEFII